MVPPRLPAGAADRGLRGEGHSVDAAHQGKGLGFKVQGLGFRVQGSGFRV